MNTKALRQKILDLAIHGKLVPQDPNDEPASVLLERIRAEKERLIKEGIIKKPKKSKATCDKRRYPYQLPDGWVWTTIGEVCSSFSTGPFGSMVHKSDYVSTNGTPIINPANIVNGRILNEGIKMVSNDKVVGLTKYRLSENDILLARRGDLTKCAIVTKSHVNSLCGTGTFFLHLIFVLPQYFKYVYSSNLVQYILKKDCVGATMDNLNQCVLANIYIPIPPLEEQMRINKRLEYYFSLLNLVEDEGNSLQVTVKQAKSKILDLAIHGKLVPQDPNDEPACELLKRINPKAEIICDNPRYGKLPKGWCICHIPDIANSLLGKTLDRSKNTGIPKDYLCAINVLWGKFDFSVHKQFLLAKNEYERYAVIKGDLMVCEGGDVGRCAVWEDDSKEIFYQNALHRIRCKEGIFNYYILYLLWHYKLNGTIDDLCKGVTIKHFTQTVMNKLDILLPPFEEQKRIVAKIEELFAQLDKIESSLQAN